MSKSKDVSVHNHEVIVKEFQGFSGSRVFLVKNSLPIGNDKSYYSVRKEGNIERNYEKMMILAEKGFAVPAVHYKTNSILSMEYIAGYDIISFLQRYDVKLLLSFVVETIERFRQDIVNKNYLDTYVNHLFSLKNNAFLPFSIDDLINRLPTHLEKSLCHGDFTFDNLIFNDNKFYMIDSSTGVYDSWIFDLAKLRQDIDGKWFLRNGDINQFNIELEFLKTELKKRYPIAFDDNIYILMLLRIYKYTNPSQPEHKFILKEIRKLWK